MADIDNLESLSNAELHAQMVAHGLPNIPVTDSSRKVLVKRLRVSLGGNAASPAAASPKKAGGNRRETMQPAAAAAQVDKLDGSAKTRRSIAFPPSDTKEADRRRKPETVAVPPRELEVAGAKTAPIQAHRTSTHLANVRVAKKPEEVITATKQRTGEKTLAVNELIILESDEEEEELMTRALDRAEEQLLAKQKAVKPQLTATVTSTQYIGQPEPIRERKQQQPQPLQRPQQQQQQPQQPLYNSSPLYPTLEPILQRNQLQSRQPLERSSLAYEPAANIAYSQQPAARTTVSSQQPAARTTVSSSYATSGRYSSYLNSPLQGAATTSAAAAAASILSHRRSPPRTYTAEFSDDTGDDTEEPPADGSKFESEFARNLARLRAERIGDRSSVAPSIRRSIRPDNDTTSAAFRRWWRSLDRKYNVMPKLYILLVLLLIYIAYRIYY